MARMCSTAIRYVDLTPTTRDPVIIHAQLIYLRYPVDVSPIRDYDGGL